MLWTLSVHNNSMGSVPIRSPNTIPFSGHQSLGLQREALRAEGIDDPANLYPDFASGGRDDRPGLDSCVRALRKGDVLVVWKLGRLGRPRSLGAGRSRSRRPHPSSASDSTRRTRSACREMECFW